MNFSTDFRFSTCGIFIRYLKTLDLPAKNNPFAGFKIFNTALVNNIHRPYKHFRKKSLNLYYTHLDNFMSNRFFLFGEKPFEAYALKKFSEIASDIDCMSDIEALMYKFSFDELVQKTVSTYEFKKLGVSFENKMVDLIDRPYQGTPNIYAEYSFVVSGDPYFLGLEPLHKAYLPFQLRVTVKGNIMSFEIDTNYRHEELSTGVMALVKSEYEMVKKYILDSLHNMNRTVDFYNNELEKFVIPLLANKLRKAERCLKIKEALNFQ